jgi:hypothetical protein
MVKYSGVYRLKCSGWLIPLDGHATVRASPLAGGGAGGCSRSRFRRQLTALGRRSPNPASNTVTSRNASHMTACPTPRRTRQTADHSRGYALESRPALVPPKEDHRRRAPFARARHDHLSDLRDLTTARQDSHGSTINRDASGQEDPAKAPRPIMFAGDTIASGCPGSAAGRLSRAVTANRRAPIDGIDCLALAPI